MKEQRRFHKSRLHDTAARPKGGWILPRRRLDEIAGMTRVLPGVSLLSPGISAILKYPQYRGEYVFQRKGGAG